MAIFAACVNERPLPGQDFHRHFGVSALVKGKLEAF